MKNVFDKIMFGLLSLILFSCSQDDAVMNGHIVGTNELESEFITLNSGVQVEKKGDNYIFGGDMVLSDEQLKNLDETGSIVGNVTGALARDLSINPLTNMPLNKSKLISTRNFGVYPTSYNLWAMVRFTYDSNLTSMQKACIKAALLDLQSKTNVRFYNSTGQSQHDNVYNIDYPYVNFIYKEGDTSESKIGRVGGRQDIELADFAFEYALYRGDYGIIEHEICHALGMMHEQQRPDRDDYVTINWNNLTSKGRSNFSKVTTNYMYRGSYDYNSLMGYSSKTSSKSMVNDTSVSMYTKKDGSLISQGNTVSDQDRMWINYLYLPYVARSDTYRELDAVVYDGNNNRLTEQERLQLQAQLNNGNPNPPANGRIENNF